jgi:hypothetical protein
VPRLNPQLGQCPTFITSLASVLPWPPLRGAAAPPLRIRRSLSAQSLSPLAEADPVRPQPQSPPRSPIRGSRTRCPSPFQRSRGI